MPAAYFLDGVGFVSSYPDDMIELFSDRMISEMVRLLAKMDDQSVKRGMLEMARAYHAVQSANDEDDATALPPRRTSA